ncbi:MAG: glycosyl hydrolase family 18 protein [Tuberibacillus sp.]
MNEVRLIKVTKAGPLVVDGIPDERWTVTGKIYELKGENEDHYRVAIGKATGEIPKTSAEEVRLSRRPKLTVAWLYGNNGNFELPYNGLDADALGLDVTSPTWFHREGDPAHPESIKVVSGGDREFVKAAHRKGYEVWGLIADFNADRNFAVYTNDQLIDKEINDIVSFAKDLNLDGINIDFEGFGSRLRDDYSRYVEKLSARLKEEGLIVSIDVTKESDSDAWGKCYDRKEIAKFVDYVAYMAYDETGRLETIPGSTGSLPWVEDGIQELLAMGIAKEHILLGVPFYTRDWQEREVRGETESVLVTAWEGVALYKAPDLGSEQSPIEAKVLLSLVSEMDGWYEVIKDGETLYLPSEKGMVLKAGESLFISEKVEPLFAKDIAALKSKYKVDISQDDRAGQEKVVYTDELGNRHEVWVENTESLGKRLDLLRQYDLAGMAAWALNQEAPLMWDVIKEKLK